jgi:hypothetical protein
MNELFELTPGSRAARKQRCSCWWESTQLDPCCRIHGMSAFRRLKQDPEGSSVIERFYACIEAGQTID